MPLPFTWNAPVTVAFGEKRLEKIGRDIGKLAGDEATVMLVSDPVLAKVGLVDRAEAAIAAGGHRVTRYTEIRSDPLASSIDAIVAQIRKDGATCVVALGGGSSMDAAKLAAALARDGDAAESYALGARPLPRNGLPRIAVPTTAGTGSEVTRTSVFSTAERKLWAYGPELLFNLALLDPTVTVGMPPHLTAATGVDASVHAIEAATNKRRNPISTAIALGSVRTLRRWLAVAVAEPENLEARGEVLIAATTAGMAFDVAGVAIAHAIGHALGEAAGVHHGRAVGLALNATMANGAGAAPDAYAMVAEVLGVETRGMTTDEAAASAPAAYDAWLREVGLKLSLDDHGLSAGDAGRIAALCFEPENKVMLETDSFAYDPANLEAAVANMLSAA